MSGFVLHPQTYADLEEIWEYIASASIALHWPHMHKQTHEFPGKPGQTPP
jgi:hypothetical protein